jgi:hypothetical protein
VEGRAEELKGHGMDFKSSLFLPLITDLSEEGILRWIRNAIGLAEFERHGATWRELYWRDKAVLVESCEALQRRWGDERQPAIIRPGGFLFATFSRLNQRQKNKPNPID